MIRLSPDTERNTPPKLTITASDEDTPVDDSWIDLLAAVCLSAARNRAEKNGRPGHGASDPADLLDFVPSVTKGLSHGTEQN